jgi:hypothetical protein
MPKRRLYDEDGGYNGLANLLDQRIKDVLTPIVAAWASKHDIRDIQSIVLQAAMEVILDERAKQL